MILIILKIFEKLYINNKYITNIQIQHFLLEYMCERK